MAHDKSPHGKIRCDSRLQGVHVIPIDKAPLSESRMQPKGNLQSRFSGPMLACFHACILAHLHALVAPLKPKSPRVAAENPNLRPTPHYRGVEESPSIVSSIRSVVPRPMLISCRGDDNEDATTVG